MSPSRPHHKYFRSVFSNAPDAANLLRAYVPEPLARVLRSSTLTLVADRFVSPDRRDSEADLLYVLLKHQPSPDPWMPLPVLNYCPRVGSGGRAATSGRVRIPADRAAASLFSAGNRRSTNTSSPTCSPTRRRSGPWASRFEYLLFHQTEQNPDSVPRALPAKLAQIAMMAAFRHHRDQLLELPTRLIGELIPRGPDSRKSPSTWTTCWPPSRSSIGRCSSRALRRNVPGRGRDVTYALV